MGLVLTLLLLPLLLGGCLGDDDPDSDDAPKREQGVDDETATNAESELLARVSAVVRAGPGESGSLSALAYTDLVAARKQLALPEDAKVGGRGKHRLLLALAAGPMFMSGTLLGPEPTLGPLGDVLDTGAINAAAGTVFAFSPPGSGDVTKSDGLAILTRQPFEEIADRLRGEFDYAERRDGLLINKDSIPEIRVATVYEGVPFPVVGDAGDRVVVFAGSVRAARAALEGAEAELTPAAKLVARLPGVTRLGQSGGDCWVAVGLSEDAAPREGAVIVVIDGMARAELLEFPTGTGPTGYPEDGEITLGQPEAMGDRAIIRFKSTDRLNPTRLPAERLESPYDCP